MTWLAPGLNVPLPSRFASLTPRAPAWVCSVGVALSKSRDTEASTGCIAVDEAHLLMSSSRKVLLWVSPEPLMFAPFRKKHPVAGLGPESCLGFWLLPCPKHTYSAIQICWSFWKDLSSLMPQHIRFSVSGLSDYYLSFNPWFTHHLSLLFPAFQHWFWYPFLGSRATSTLCLLKFFINF